MITMVTSFKMMYQKLTIIIQLLTISGVLLSPANEGDISTLVPSLYVTTPEPPLKLLSPFSTFLN